MSITQVTYRTVLREELSQEFINIDLQVGESSQYLAEKIFRSYVERYPNKEFFFQKRIDETLFASKEVRNETKNKTL